MVPKLTKEDVCQQSIDLTDSMGCINKCLGHLHDALLCSGEVTAIVLLPLLARAAALQADISALIDALNATE